MISVVTISYKIKFIDSARFLATSLSNLFHDLIEVIHKNKGKHCDCLKDSVKDSLIKYKWLSCNKNYLKKIDEELKKCFKNNKFILLLRTGVCPYEYMDDWERFNERTLLEKDEFYGNLYMEDITDADYMHAKRVCKDFEIKQLGKYHDFCLTFGWYFRKLQKNIIKKLSFRSCKISFCSWVSMGSSFKKDWSKIRTINWHWHAINGWKSIRGEICHAIHQYAKANNKYTKDYDKNKKSLYLQYWDANTSYGWTMWQKLPVNNFEWPKET